MALSIDSSFRWGCLIALPGLAALATISLVGSPSLGEGLLLVALAFCLTGYAIFRARNSRFAGIKTTDVLLKALVDSDYSVRANLLDTDEDLRQILSSINELACRLQEEQRSHQESLHLLSKTLASLDGAVFVFDESDQLRMINPAGERLLGDDRYMGRDSRQLGLSHLFDVPSGDVWASTLAGGDARFQVNHAPLRRGGRPGRLLVLQPVERALRGEEARAFRKLLRVLSHEINNSMAPISSMAETVRSILPAPGAVMNQESFDDIRQALEVVGQRSKSLSDFIGQYAQLARLPPPRIEVVNIRELCDDVGLLFSDQTRIIPGIGTPYALCDRTQVSQVLINLLRNAVEAGGESKTEVSWRQVDDSIVLEVADSGKGLPKSDSLFTPFFTTKPDGAGIGLALSRSIIEAQNGSLTLRNRKSQDGAIATVRLALARMQ